MGDETRGRVDGRSTDLVLRQTPGADTTAGEKVAAPVEVRVEARDSLTFAMEQNGVPLIMDVAIENRSGARLDGLRLELRLDPDLGEVETHELPAVGPGERWRTGPLEYRLPPGRLRQVVERERAVLSWSLHSTGERLAGGRCDVDVMAYNQWPGILRAPPGLLAAFVTPNHPVVASVLQRVRERLGQATGDNALEGYQRKSPSRVLATVAALYETLQSLGLSYAGVPASFEKTGQKIRLPEDVLRDRMGCCLDLTVLVAACCEQMGLRSLLVVVDGHAYPGLWLVEDRFPEGVVVDGARMRNQVKLGHLLVFDSTTMVQQPLRPFDHAVRLAIELLADSTFVCAVDVAVAREEFRPLPLRAATPPEGAPAPAEAPNAARELIDRILAEAAATPASANASSAVPVEHATIAREPSGPTKSGPTSLPPKVAGRFRKWQDRLLDLSLRNRLLHFKVAGASALPLDVPDIARFEDLLADGTTFDLVPRADRFAGDERDEEKVEARLVEDEVRARWLADMNSGSLHVRLFAGELASRARKLARDARLDLEEGGASTLYAAIGFLRWLEVEGGEPRYAPLLLYPCALEVERGRGRVRLRRLPDEPTVNVTLVEKLRRDFDVDLGALGELQPDESGVDVPALLKGVRLAIQGKAGWEVLDVASLGLFAFTKFLMWKDLDENAGLFLENPIVERIASGAAPAGESAIAAVDPARLDETHAPSDLPCVVDADSTQMAAVASALAGRSFVLQGPPGTGKSQTITNLVAAALARGKSVLFVSEKMAALEVVSRRLGAAGLGDFCLELHSHKANKKQVLESLGRTLERSERHDAGGFAARSTEIAALRARLNAYAEALHRPRPIGLTFYQASSRLLALREAPDVRIPIERAAELP